MPQPHRNFSVPSNQIAWIILLCVLLSSVSCAPKQTPTLLIATSANMQFAMKRLVSEFESQSGTSCQIVLGSSGKLSAQISEGAPYHLFVSADMEYPLHLYAENLAEKPPEIYALGKLVLWSLKDSLVSWKRLDTKSIHHFAIPNPQIAPYGRAAVEALQTAGFYEQLESRFVLGENVAQTAQFVLSGAADYGIVSKSIVSARANQGIGAWSDLPEKDYTPVSQGAILLNPGAQEPQAIAFYNFLFSAEAKRILNTFGYDEPME